MLCKKCLSPGSVKLRKRDVYCENCFVTNTNHKFRSCIGKHRVLTSNEKVMLSISGGMGSLVLLDLVYAGATLESHKKLRISPVCVHITGMNADVTNSVIEQCQQYEYDVYIIDISEYFNKDFKVPDKNKPAYTDQSTINNLSSELKNVSLTEHKDFLSKICKNLLCKIASMLHCKYIFTAETTTTLASNLLSNIALGRGSQVEHDIGFCDSRDGEIKILRPMKDISKEELDYYAHVKTIVPKEDFVNKDTSLQTLIKSFVTDLQDNYQATISTVCKTAEKLGSNNFTGEDRKCSLCQSAVGMKNSKLTAYDATNYSKAVCFGQSTQAEQSIEKKNNLCYSCSRNKCYNIS